MLELRHQDSGVELRQEVAVRHVDEHGSTVQYTVPAGLPVGYWATALVDTDGRVLAEGEMATAPPAPRPSRRLIGLSAQLYQVRSARSWGAGDLSDLRGLIEWASAAGSLDFVLINPLNARETRPPINPSPYMPTSHEFFDPTYLCVEEVPGFELLSVEERRDILIGAAHLQDLVGTAELVDRNDMWQAKRQALGLVHERLERDSGDYLSRLLASWHGESLEDFSTWCALADRFGSDFTRWPAELRRPGPAAQGFAADRGPEVRFHMWLQLLVHAQLGHAQQRARENGQAVGVVMDLPVGFSRTGADAWLHADDLAAGVSIGAPPDGYNAHGQDWQMTPYRSDSVNTVRFAQLRTALRRVLEVSGGVRVDHVKGWDRSWWIPDGAPPTDGVYVRQNLTGALAVMALEAHRARAVLIGEDMSPREEDLRTALGDFGVLGTSTLWFEKGSDGTPVPPEKWRRDCLASLGTHDMPPTEAYVRGEHLVVQNDIDLLTEPVDAAVERHRGRMAEQLDAVGRALGRTVAQPAVVAVAGVGADAGPSGTEAETTPGAGVAEKAEANDLLGALHDYLLRTPAVMIAVQLCDVVSEQRAINYPGTGSRYPNWQLALVDRTHHPVRLDTLRVPSWMSKMLDEQGG